MMRSEELIKAKIGELTMKLASITKDKYNEEEIKCIKNQILGGLDMLSWALGGEGRGLIDVETTDLNTLLK